MGKPFGWNATVSDCLDQIQQLKKEYGEDNRLHWRLKQELSNLEDDLYTANYQLLKNDLTTEKKQNFIKDINTFSAELRQLKQAVRDWLDMPKNVTSDPAVRTPKRIKRVARDYPYRRREGRLVQMFGDAMRASPTRARNQYRYNSGRPTEEGVGNVRRNLFSGEFTDTGFIANRPLPSFPPVAGGDNRNHFAFPYTSTARVITDNEQGETVVSAPSLSHSPPCSQED